MAADGLTHNIAVIALLAGALSGASADVRGQGAVSSGRPPRHGQSAVPAVKDGPLTAADATSISRKWGVRIESLRLASGGYMLEFRYRILDANKAQPLFSRKFRPLLKDDGSPFESTVPSPPTTGALRSTRDAKAGRTYFMFFANPSRFVTAGKTVTVSIGDFVVSGIPVTDESSPAAPEKEAQERS